MWFCLGDELTNCSTVSYDNLLRKDFIQAITVRWAW